MNTNHRDDPLRSFEEWHAYSTGQCGLKLSGAYCRERVSELRDDTSPSTRSFVESYGQRYRDTVVSWFERAASEATG